MRMRSALHGRPTGISDQCDAEKTRLSVDTVREEQAIRQVTDHLADTYSAEHVESTVATARQRFDGYPISDFIPILVERMVRGELTREAETTADAYSKPTTDVQPKTTSDAYPETTAETQPETTGDTSNSRRRHFPVTFRLPRPRIARATDKGLFSVLLAAVVVVAAVVVGIIAGGGSAHPLTTARGVVGSEKQAFFEDPKVRRAFARNGVNVQVDPAGSRQIDTLDLGRYDFAFPSSAPAADRIERQRHVSASTRRSPRQW
ncbi:MAG: hypothetical protein JWR24_3756 [Actinoallomurus sp.]|nr:hypothetical protein [Actinoallomurus sp.]